MRSRRATTRHRPARRPCGARGGVVERRGVPQLLDPCLTCASSRGRSRWPSSGRGPRGAEHRFPLPDAGRGRPADHACPGRAARDRGLREHDRDDDQQSDAGPGAIATSDCGSWRGIARAIACASRQPPYGVPSVPPGQRGRVTARSRLCRPTVRVRCRTSLTVAHDRRDFVLRARNGRACHPGYGTNGPANAGEPRPRRRSG